MKTIKLPCFGIIVKVEGEGGSISSDLTDSINYVDDGIAMDAIESIVLAHAVAGVDIESPAYIEGIETAVEACTNHI